jgi:serine/threonine protein kinase
MGVWLLFDKIKKLGEGSYGSVYLAQSKDTKKFFAIKVLKKKDAKYKYMDIPYTSLREVSILKDLDHENIVK